MRFLLAPFGTRGDVQPMLALGLALRAGGHEVVFAGPANDGPTIESHGFPFHSFGLDVRDLIVAGGARTHSTRWQWRHLHEIVPAQFATFAACGLRPDVVVGAGIQIASGSYAEMLGVPHVFAIYCPVALPNDDTAPPVLRHYGLPTWINRTAWRVFETVGDVGLRALLNGGRRSLGLSARRRPARDLWKNSTVLLASDPTLAPAPPTPATLHHTDPWSLRDRRALPADLDAFVGAGPPPVYIGFGSMVTGRPAFVTRVLLEAAGRAGCRLVLGSGWDALGADSLPDWCYVAGDVSHQSLFPRMAAVAHHGGAGTTTTAARAGVPQLLLPHLLDQFYWAHRVQTLGLGPRPLPIGRVSVSRLADRLRSLLGNGEFRQRASELGAIAAGRDGTPAAVKLLETLPH